MHQFNIRGKVFRYPGPSGWYFIQLGRKVSKEIEHAPAGKVVGWVYVKVKATIVETLWDTTLFPSKEGAYLLAIKAGVRKKEESGEGDVVSVTLSLI